MSTSKSSEERLLNLVIALMNTTSHMTKAQIVQTVSGYNRDASDSALERMFERDKDTLRTLGLPLITIDTGAHASEIGYRIDKDSYGLGEFNFTPAEFSVLSLAAGLWQENTALASDSFLAMTKLRSTYLGHTDTDALAGLAPRLAEATGISEQLIDSISERRAVTFQYRAAHTGQLTTRRVQPWRVAVRAGAWYLIGFDIDREAARVFRFSRFEGRVKNLKNMAPFDIPATIDVDLLLGSNRLAPPELATLAIRKDRAQSLRIRGERLEADPRFTDFDMFEVPFVDPQRFSEEIVGYTQAVLVLSPDSLRAAVLDRLQAAVNLAGSGDTHLGKVTGDV